jgi:hypothetical protein|tara:strand:+ start:196 stop:330 length:135 start_codon:yes stop_codon:yes gene_type:complete
MLLQRQAAYVNKIEHWDGVDHVKGQIQGTIDSQMNEGLVIMNTL